MVLTVLELHFTKFKIIQYYLYLRFLKLCSKYYILSRNKINGLIHGDDDDMKQFNSSCGTVKNELLLCVKTVYRSLKTES
jgi:hypothetical protein